MGKRKLDKPNPKWKVILLLKFLHLNFYRQTNDISSMQISAITEGENIHYCSNKGDISAKEWSKINLLSDGSENMVDESDICLNKSKSKTKHKKKVF